MTDVATTPQAVPGTAEPSRRAGHVPDRRGWARPALLYAALLVGLVLLLGPFLWMVLGSLKTQQELLRVPPTWLPDEPTISNFGSLFDRLAFGRYFWNSTVVAVAITVSNLLFCSMLGYALAKLRFFGQRPLFLTVMATLMVPSTVVLVPLFVLMTNLGLVNTHLGLILPTAAGPFGVFLMRQFMLGIPDELLEAARVDGASEWRLYWQIALPLAGPALATLAILTFMQAWNAFLWPLVNSTQDEMYTLPVALAVFARGEHQSNYGLLMAGSVVIVTPVLIVFLALQRYFTQGIALTGTKG
jgi:multiple sugar transport system permease protein